MAMDLKQLQALLSQSATASSSTPALQDQLARANALRDTPAPTPTRGMSYVSPLQHLARGFNQIRGQGKAQRATEGLAKYRQQMADADSAKTMYGLQTTAENRTQDLDWRTQKEANLGIRAGEQRDWQDATAETLNQNRADAAQTQTDAAIAKSQKSQDWKESDATAKYAHEMAKAALTAGKVAGVNTAGFKPMTAKEAGEFESAALDAQNVMGVAETFKDEYANPSEGLPFAGEVSNYVTREAPILANKAMKARQNWWSNYKALYELPTRHDLFGSALTKNESSEWRASAINPNMEAGQIKTKLATLKKLRQKAMSRMRQNAMIKARPQAWIDANIPESGVSSSSDPDTSGWGDVTVSTADGGGGQSSSGSDRGRY